MKSDSIDAIAGRGVALGPAPDPQEAAPSATPKTADVPIRVTTVETDLPDTRSTELIAADTAGPTAAPASAPAPKTRVGVSIGGGIYDGNNQNPREGTQSYYGSLGIEGSRDLGSKGRFVVGGGLYHSHAGLNQFADVHPGDGSVSTTELLARVRVQSGDADSRFRAFIGPTAGVAFNRAEFEGTLSFDPDSTIEFDGRTVAFSYGVEAGVRAALAGSFDVELSGRWRQTTDNEHDWTVRRPNGDVITGQQNYHATEIGARLALLYKF